MGYEVHIEQLLADGALAEDEDGRLELTGSFLDVVDEQRTVLENGEREWHELVAEVVAEDATVQHGLDLAWKQSEFLVYLLALSSYVGEDLDAEWLQTTAVVAQLGDPRPRGEGAPEAFLPIHGDWLGVFMELFPHGIVYVWREDCEPCDIMVEEFNDIFDRPDDLALFAIYGPDCARFLHEEYDVSGGPATLFVVDGEVDTRLYGAHYREVIDNEIEVTREIIAE